MRLFMQTLWQQLEVSSSSPSLPLSSVAMKIVLLLQLLGMVCFSHGVGYSYTRFVGPVIGPEKKILLNNEHTGIGSIHYVGYPKYQFSYGIEDAEQRMLQNRKETRDGDNVQGVYSVVDPDGALRVVKYTADDVNGFQAEVTRNGFTSLHGNTYLNDEKQNPYSGYSHEISATEASQEDDADDDTDYTNNNHYNNSYKYDYNDEQKQVGSNEEEDDFDDAEQIHIENNNDSIY